MTEFELTQDIKDLGVSKIVMTKDSLYIYNGKSFAQSRFNKNELKKTLDELQDKMVYDGCFGDEKTVQKIILLLSEIWIRSEESNGKGKNKVKEEFDADQKYKDSIIVEINKLREDNAGLTSESWKTELIKRYDTLRSVVEEDMPEIWTGLEFELSALRILNIVGNTLPLIAILLARLGSGKTQILNMLRRWLYSYYTDGFTAKSFVSHSTAVSKEELEEIDMLPRIENKIFLTPELAAMFGLKDDDLKQVLGLVTRIADGNGLSNDSGAHGHRGYNRDIMFVWVGAAVDIPYKVYKILADTRSYSRYL